jgi:phthiodiolone/phenolphthiodiolone dimycocerosates ketoreductase
VPESMLRGSILNGTPDEVLDQVAEFRDCGVEYAVLTNVSIVHPSLRKAMASTAPLLKILRGLRKF